MTKESLPDVPEFTPVVKAQPVAKQADKPTPAATPQPAPVASST